MNCITCYELESLFKKLYSDKNIDTMKVSQLEFAYVRGFDSEFEPKCIIDNLLCKPSMFLELISYYYKKDDSNDKEEQNNNASVLDNAFEVLIRIKRLPGQNGNEINKDVFNSWLNAVKVLAKDEKYETACDIEVGEILSYSPVDEDGIWPHKCVREYFELNSSETLEKSFRIGLRNQRGVYAVTGGDEEERIADKYYDYAQKLKITFPKTSAILYALGDDYKCDSKYERARELKGYF